MTIASTTNRKTFAGDDVTTSFGTSPIVFFNTSDLVAQVVTTATGAATTLTENTHYTVSGGAGTTGTVNLSGGTSPHGALATGTTLVILRVVPLTQAVDFVNNDINDAEVLEDALDKLTMIDQQQQEALGRAVTLPASESGNTVLPALADRASAYLAFDTNGNMIAAANPGTYPASPFMATVLDDANASAALSTLGVSAFVKTLLDDTDALAARATLGVVSPVAGAVQMLQDAAGVWHVYKPDLTEVDISASTTGGIQEAINEAVSSNRPLFFYGHGLITCSTAIQMPTLHNIFMWFGGNFTINFSAAVTGSGLIFDSCMQLDFQFHGELAYGGNAAAVLLNPVTPLVGDPDTGIKNSKFFFKTILCDGGVGNSCFTAKINDTPVPTGIVHSEFEFLELRGGAYGFQVVEAPLGVGFFDNQIRCPHIHVQTNTSVQVGNLGTTLLSSNIWDIGILTAVNAIGLDTMDNDSTYKINVWEAEGMALVGVKLRAQALRNLFLPGRIVGTTKVQDDTGGGVNTWVHGHERLLFSVHKNAVDQVGVATATATKLTWSTKEFDPYGKFDVGNGRWTPGKIGFYRLSCVATWQGFAIDQCFNIISIYKNGGPVKHVSFASSGLGQASLVISALVSVMAETDYFEIFVQQNSGANQTILGAPALTYFQGERVD